MSSCHRGMILWLWADQAPRIAAPGFQRLTDYTRVTHVQIRLIVANTQTATWSKPSSHHRGNQVKTSQGSVALLLQYRSPLWKEVSARPTWKNIITPTAKWSGIPNIAKDLKWFQREVKWILFQRKSTPVSIFPKYKNRVQIFTVYVLQSVTFDWVYRQPYGVNLSEIK